MISYETDDYNDMFFNPELCVPYEYITTKENLLKHVRAIKESPAIGIDTETTGLQPFTTKIRLIQIAISDLSYPVLILDLFKMQDVFCILKELFVSPAVKVFHNASFDLLMLKTHNIPITGNIFDTMIAAQVVECGVRTKGFKLKQVVKKYLNQDMSKEEQVSDWTKEDLTPNQLNYAAKDARVLIELREILKKEIIKEKLVRIAALEFNCIPAVVEMEYNGVYLNTEKWDVLTRKYEEEMLIHQKQLLDFLGEGVNINSWEQLVSAFRKKAIYIDDTSNATLVLNQDIYPELKWLVDYRDCNTALTKFLWEMKQRINPVTKRIHSNYFQIGCMSGRFSCREPNIQQLPRVKEFRECFQAEYEDTCLVTSDFSQIELRVGAEISGDRVMIEAYKNGEDLHCLTAANLNSKDKTSVTKEERQTAKSVNFGLIFGMSADTLKNYAKINYNVDMSLEEAYNYRKKFFKTYTGVHRWHYMHGHKGKINKETKTLCGRKRKWLCEPVITELFNTPVQGTAADILKLAMGNILNNLKGTSAKLIRCCHDELNIECDQNEAQEVGKILQQTMEDAGREIIKEVPIIAEFSVGKSFADK
jgi:DNA polymerase I